MQKIITLAISRFVVLLVALISHCFAAEPLEPSTKENVAGKLERIVKTLTLEECLDQAIQNNHRRPASRYAVVMAEAQHRQTLAGYWPQLNIRGTYQRMDESPNFLFPASSISIPAQNLPIPMGGTIPVTIPGVGTVPVGSFAIPAQTFQIPAQDVKLMDPQSFVGSANLTWLLYDGGMRKGYNQQAKGLVDLMKEEARRTDLEIVDSVKRFYYGSVMSQLLYQIGNETLARMETTLNLTETMYKEGSGKVNKADFLDNKVMVESIRAMVALLEKNVEMSKAALANTMGLKWNETIQPATKDIPFAPYAENLESLVSTAYRFNPDWAKIEAGIRAAEGSVKTARSGHYPKIALTGEIHRWWNDYRAGIATSQNKEGGTVGIGMEIPIFDGFLTRNKVAETKARLDKIREEQILLKEGIGLQIKDLFLGLTAAYKSHQATLDAMNAAIENRDLNIRAYQNELVDTEKVIRAQLMEAMMSAQHFKTRYDHVALQSQLNLLVGTEFLKKLEGK